MKIFETGKHRKYTVSVGSGIFSDAGRLARRYSNAEKVLVVCDENVGPLYCSELELSLATAGFTVFKHTYPAVAGVKSLDTVSDILLSACEVGMGRNDLFLALGGGVCHDLTGLAAALYRRGADFMSIPTSLAAQADGCIGGKADCDLNGFPDSVGVIKEPIAVLVDVALLNTLPQNRFAEGMAEVIKAAALGSADLFRRLAGSAASPELEDIVFESLKYKNRLLGDDSSSENRRQLLGFGHTVGYAIEKYYNFSGVTHGEAVSIGMVAITEASERAGLTVPGTAAELSSCLASYSLPTGTTIPPATLAELAVNNIKVRSDTLRIPMISEIGKGFIKTIPADKLTEFLTGEK